MFVMHFKKFCSEKLGWAVCRFTGCCQSGRGQQHDYCKYLIDTSHPQSWSLKKYNYYIVVIVVYYIEKNRMQCHDMTRVLTAKARYCSIGWCCFIFRPNKAIWLCVYPTSADIWSKVRGLRRVYSHGQRSIHPMVQMQCSWSPTLLNLQSAGTMVWLTFSLVWLYGWLI